MLDTVEPMNSKRFTVPLALVLALAITPALAGCFGNPIEQIVENATDGQVDVGGEGLPDGFPEAEVPIVDGEILFPMGFGDEGAKVWNVAVKVDGLEVADEIRAQLEGAGFTENEAGIGGATEDGATLLYANAKYTVLVMVSKDTENGFLANYTVSQVAQ